MQAGKGMIGQLDRMRDGSRGSDADLCVSLHLFVMQFLKPVWPQCNPDLKAPISDPDPSGLTGLREDTDLWIVGIIVLSRSL